MGVKVIGLGIVVQDNLVLIGRRKEEDPSVKNLTWVFSGGRFQSLDFEAEIVREVREEAGLEVKVERLIHARLFPVADKSQILLLYFHCTPIGGRERAGGDLAELKWVKPTETYRKYFTTHTAGKIKRFLQELEKGMP